MKVCVVGSGYVGLVTGTCLAEAGNTVHCVDKERDKVDALLRGEVPIYEPGLGAMIQQNVAAVAALQHRHRGGGGRVRGGVPDRGHARAP
jgi:UDP-glucose 6-dehydrogenase